MLFVFFAWAAHAQAPDVGADATRDTLVYKDGDRVHGRVISEAGNVIVFKSERFGVLQVPSGDAVVIKAAKATQEKIVAAAAKTGTPSEREEAEKVSIWDRFSPAVLTAKVRDFFGPWHGKVAFADELVNDTAHRDNVALDTKLTRKFARDAVDLTARYDYDQTNGTPTTDVVKGTGTWRHDFNKIEFFQYRPSVEWNRASIHEGVPDHYVLLQQDLGFGVNVWTTPARKLRLGVSESLFDVWNSAPVSDHGSRGVASLFDEAEFALPWRMTLSQRGVWYPETHHGNSWENQVELGKKLTETLSVAIRHEIRRNNPDGSSPDYTRLKLLLGLDF